MTHFTDGPNPLKMTDTFYRSPFSDPSKSYENSKLNMGILCKEYDYVDKSSKRLFTDPWWNSRLEQTDRTLGHEPREFEKVMLTGDDPRIFPINPRRRYPDRSKGETPIAQPVAVPTIVQPVEPTHEVENALKPSAEIQEIAHDVESSPVVDAQLENVGSTPPVIAEPLVEEAAADKIVEDVVITPETTASPAPDVTITEAPEEATPPAEAPAETPPAIIEEPAAEPAEETPAEEVVESFFFGESCYAPKIFIVIVIILCGVLVFVTINAFRASSVGTTQHMPEISKALPGGRRSHRLALKGKAF
jgi:hypothetical protein